ncbi:MAG: TfoX/Sxy family protein [Candidatus Dormibacteria bacterium]
MSYDEALAARMRSIIGDDPDVREMKMFGGLGFLVAGNMAVAASGQGGAMVRVDPADSERLVQSTKAQVMEMRGRRMVGWLRLDTEDLAEDIELEEWVRRGMRYARSLPPK